METYTWMRAFADSWMLLAMTLFFLGVVLWTWRPGSREKHDDIANIPLRTDDVLGAPGLCGGAQLGQSDKETDNGRA